MKGRQQDEMQMEEGRGRKDEKNGFRLMKSSFRLNGVENELAEYQVKSLYKTTGCSNKHASVDLKLS